MRSSSFLLIVFMALSLLFISHYKIFLYLYHRFTFGARFVNIPFKQPRDCSRLIQERVKKLFDQISELTENASDTGLSDMQYKDENEHVQNLGQLKERYGNWQDFMSSCDKQFFAVNDHGSAEEISKMLGDYVERWVEGKEGETKSIDKNRPLRSPSEVMDELKKGSKLQYVLPADGSPLRLKLVSFKKNFRKYGIVKGNKFG